MPKVPRKRLLKALDGEAMERPPIWLMRQAGRYLPEYRALREQAGSFLALCYNPDLAVEVTLQPIRRFGFDAAILFADILLVPQALGQPLSFVEGEGPKLEPVRSNDAVARLGQGDLHAHLSPVYETVRRVRHELPQDCTLIGFAGAPWTVATYMVAGGGGDHALAKSWAMKDVPGFQALIDKLSDATVEYLIAQVDAGAEALQLFDSWAGSVPAHLFQRLCVAPARHIADRVREKHPEVPLIGFPRGAGVNFDNYASATGLAGVSIDSGIPADWAARMLQPTAVVQGNLDPQLLVAGGDAMRRETEALLRTLGGRNYIFNLGHGIVPETPVEHVAELVRQVQNWRQ